MPCAVYNVPTCPGGKERSTVKNLLYLVASIKFKPAKSKNTTTTTTTTNSTSTTTTDNANASPAVRRRRRSAKQKARSRAFSKGKKDQRKAAKTEKARSFSF